MAWIVILQLTFIIVFIAATTSLIVAMTVVTTNHNATRPTTPSQSTTPAPTESGSAPVEVIYGPYEGAGIGRKLSLSSDGTQLIANGEDGACVWLYESNNILGTADPIQWELKRTYCAPNGEDSVWSDVAMCSNGLTFVGAIYNRRIHIYDRASTSDPWPTSPTHTIPLEDGQGCGETVDITIERDNDLNPDPNCDILIVGCTDFIAGNVGAIQVYNRTSRVSFENTANLTVALNNSIANGLGTAIDLSSGGRMILAGAHMNRGSNGTIHVFRYTAESGWVEQGDPAYFDHESFGAASNIGRSVCISADLSEYSNEMYAVASSYDAISSTLGAVVVFRFGDDGNWIPAHYTPITGFGGGSEHEPPYLFFGASISCGNIGDAPFVTVTSLTPDQTKPALQLCQLQMGEGFGYCYSPEDPLADYPEHVDYNLTDTPGPDDVYGTMGSGGEYTMLAFSRADGRLGRIYTKRQLIGR